VSVETTTVADSADQVDVNYTVEEKPTGSLLLGAGFSSVDKLVVSGSVSQANVFGSGKFVSVQVNSGKVNQNYSLSYLNPYFTVDGVSQGFDVYNRTTDASSLSVGSYVTRTLGGGVKFGYPLSESDSILFGLNAETVKLETNVSSPFQYGAFVSQFGSRYSYGTGTVGWGRDLRDSVLLPSRGTLSKASIEAAGGNLQYYRLNLSHQWFRPLTRTTTFSLGGELGAARGLGGKPVPFFKNFYGGGPGSVRGYRSFSLGPQDAQTNVLGGTRKIGGNAEFSFPMPGAGQDRSMRLAAFIDAGQVYGATEKISLSELRYSAGLGFAWNSPFGPLRVSIAQPLNEKKGIDRIERVQLNFGSTF
jgi:outer membrane protein insertion porin family